MSVLLGVCRRVPMKMGTRSFQRADAAAAVSTIYMQSAASWPLPTAASPYSTTAARRTGKKKEIGVGLKDEEMRPGERSQVCVLERRGRQQGGGGVCCVLDGTCGNLDRVMSRQRVHSCPRLLLLASLAATAVGAFMLTTALPLNF